MPYQSELARSGQGVRFFQYKEEALKYFNLHKEYCLETLKLGRSYSEKLYLNYDLAGIYAFLGEKEKAYVNLRTFNQKERMPLWWLVEIKIDPLFDNIRDEPEFQQILNDVETKYQAEHERVRKWLEENDML